MTKFDPTIEYEEPDQPILSESSNCIVQGSGPNEYITVGTTHRRFPSSVIQDCGYIQKTNQAGAIQAHWEYIRLVSDEDIDIKSVCYIHKEQIFNDINDPNSQNYNIIDYDVIVAVGKISANNDDDALIFSVKATTGELLNSLTLKTSGVTGSDCFNSVKFKQLLNLDNNNRSTIPTDKYSLVAAGYTSVAANNKDVLIATFSLPWATSAYTFLPIVSLNLLNSKTWGDSDNEDYGMSVDLMGNPTPYTAGKHWTYVICGGSRVYNTNNLNGCMIIVDHDLNRVSDFRTTMAGDECYNSVKFIGGTIEYWCQGFIVAGYKYHPTSPSGPYRERRNLTLFNHCLNRTYSREYTLFSQGTEVEDSYGADVVCFKRDNSETGTGCALPSFTSPTFPYNNTDCYHYTFPVTGVDWDFVMVGWRKTKGSSVKKPILTNVNQHLVSSLYKDYMSPLDSDGRPNDPFNTVYCQPLVPDGAEGSWFNSLAKVNEGGAVRILGETSFSNVLVSGCLGVGPAVYPIKYEKNHIFYVTTDKTYHNTATYPNSGRDRGQETGCSIDEPLYTWPLCGAKIHLYDYNPNNSQWYEPTYPCATRPNLNVSSGVEDVFYNINRVSTPACYTDICSNTIQVGEGIINNQGDNQLTNSIGTSSDVEAKLSTANSFLVSYDMEKKQIYVKNVSSQDVDVSLVLSNLIGSGSPIGEVMIHSNSAISLPLHHNLVSGVYSLKIQSRTGNIVWKLIMVP